MYLLIAVQLLTYHPPILPVLLALLVIVPLGRTVEPLLAAVAENGRTARTQRRRIKRIRRRRRRRRRRRPPARRWPPGRRPRECDDGVIINELFGGPLVVRAHGSHVAWNKNNATVTAQRQDQGRPHHARQSERYRKWMVAATAQRWSAETRMAVSRNAGCQPKQGWLPTAQR